MEEKNYNYWYKNIEAVEVREVNFCTDDSGKVTLNFKLRDKEVTVWIEYDHLKYPFVYELSDYEINDDEVNEINDFVVCFMKVFLTIKKI